jgi:putative addiction module killer protein
MSPIDDNKSINVERTETFAAWLEGLRDRKGAMRISARIDRLEAGYWGDVKPVGSGVSELRVHSGPGYRVYLARRGDAWTVLLCGGDKDGQTRDIREAQRIWKEMSRDD